MTTDGFGGVSRRAGGGAVISAGPLELTRRGMVMDLSINLTVDYSGLEAGVGVAKRYHGCHRGRVV